MAENTSAARRRKIGAQPQPTTSVYPVTVRGKMPSTRSGVTTFARIEFTPTHAYIATSPNKGRILAAVDKIDITGTERTNLGGKKGNLTRDGQVILSWTGCGCSNSWGTKTREQIIAKGDR